MNGRVYDPVVGRFLSVDPVFQFPEDTQSLNPYSYVRNSPLSATDPTGFCEAEKPCEAKASGGKTEGGKQAKEEKQQLKVDKISSKRTFRSDGGKTSAMSVAGGSVAQDTYAVSGNGASAQITVTDGKITSIASGDPAGYMSPASSSSTGTASSASVDTSRWKPSHLKLKDSKYSDLSDDEKRAVQMIDSALATLNGVLSTASLSADRTISKAAKEALSEFGRTDFFYSRQTRSNRIAQGGWFSPRNEVVFFRGMTQLLNKEYPYTPSAELVRMGYYGRWYSAEHAFFHVAAHEMRHATYSNYAVTNVERDADMFAVRLYPCMSTGKC
jgi:hypothetical protein